MVKFTAAILAAATVIAGVQAACPANGLFCGSELLDVYRCTTRSVLQGLTPPGDEINTDIYPTDSNGNPQIPSASCKERGCRNSNLNANPPQFATCF